MKTIQNELPSQRSEIKRSILFVTGLSGAGKTTVLRALEDLGFYCVDNFPVPLIVIFLGLIFDPKNNIQKIALGIDVRSQQFLATLINELDQLNQSEYAEHIKIIFINAQKNTLIKRYSETRRRHPLANSISLEAALNKELELIGPIKERAHIVFDTDNFTIHQLRKWVEEVLNLSEQRKLIVQLMSFGFKYGLPAESNLVFDLRFLPNPYFVPELKPFSGKDKAIQNYLFSQQIVKNYYERLSQFILFSLENFYAEGRFFINIGIGCTGGRHRSVAFVEQLQRIHVPFVSFIVTHRDVERESI